MAIPLGQTNHVTGVSVAERGSSNIQREPESGTYRRLECVRNLNEAFEGFTNHWRRYDNQKYPRFPEYFTGIKSQSVTPASLGPLCIVMVPGPQSNVSSVFLGSWSPTAMK